MTLALLTLRLLLASLLALHGAAKLGGFGGGPASTAEEFAREGLGGGRSAAFLAGTVQVAAAVLLLLGAVTPVACSMAVGVMTTAALTRVRHGFWSQRGGVEYPLVLCVLPAALALSGPGSASVDNALSLLPWPVWAGPAAIAVGVAAGAATWTALGRIRPAS